MHKHKYFAFISYKHKDIRFARKLQEKLEFYGLKSILNEIKTKNLSADRAVLKMLEERTREKSAYFSGQHTSDSFFANIFDFIKDTYRMKFSRNEQKLYPMCRDDGEFSSGNLNEIIETHLDDSKKLILLCSESSLQSDYVKNEIIHFVNKDKGSFKNIIFVNVYNDDAVPGELTKKLSQYKNAALIVGNDEDNIEQLMINGRDKNCHLKIIASILGVDYSIIKRREKIRRRKKVAIITVVSILAAMILLWIGKGKVINDNIEYALEKNDIAESIELLLDTKNTANRTLHSDTAVMDALSKVCEYESGQLLRKVRFSNDYYSSSSENSVSENGNLYVFHNDKNDEDVVYDVVSGEEILRYNFGEGVLKLSNSTEINVESASNASIGYVDDQSAVIYTSVIGEAQKYHLVDYIHKKVKTIEIPEVSVRDVSTEGIYYTLKDDSALYFMSFDKEQKKIQGNDRAHHLKDNGTYTIGANEMFQGISNCIKIFGSENNDNIYVTTKDNFLYCFDGRTLDLKFQIPCRGNTFKFAENGTVMVGCGNMSEASVEYMLFNEDTGEIIKKVNAWALPVFDISDDGKNIAYSINGNIALEEIATGKMTTIECERPVISCGFRSDDNVLWTFDRRGELCTWAIEARTGIIEMFDEVIFDRNDNNICWVSDDANTYRYDISKKELTKILNRGVCFAGQSYNCIKVSMSIPESKMPIHRWFDKQSGKILLDNEDELLEKDYYVLDKDGDKLLSEEWYISDDEENEIFRKFKDKLQRQEGLELSRMTQVSKGKKYMAVYGKYYDRKGKEHPVFRIYDVNKEAIKFEFRYEDDKLYPFEDERNMQIREIPVFSEGDSFFVIYEDADDLKIKTILYDKKGKEILKSNGYPIYLKGNNKYWSKNVVFSVNGINKIYNFDDNEISSLNKAKNILLFIEKTNTRNDLTVTQNTEAIAYNDNSEFYLPEDPFAIPEIKLLCNNDHITVENDILRLSGIIRKIEVEASAPSGIYNLSYSIDGKDEGKIQGNNVWIPDEYENNQAHTLEIIAESATGITNKLSQKFICDNSNIRKK